MKKFTQLYNMISREWTENGSGMDRVKSRITPHLSLIAMLMMLVVCLFGVNEKAWGYVKSIVNVYSSPTSGGNVYVGTDNSCGASSCGDKTEDWADKTTGNWYQTDGNNTFYLCNNPKSGYVFKGWASSADANSGEGKNNNPYSKSVSGSAATTGGTTHNFWAIFARLAGSPASGNTISFGDVTVQSSKTSTLTIYADHAGTVSLSKTGSNTGDFTITENSSAISSFTSNGEVTKTITITFTPQDKGPRSCTLTVSSDNGLSSLTYTLTGTGYSTPSFEWKGNDMDALTSGSTTLGIGDTLRAICQSGQTVSYTSYSTSYFTATTDAQGKNVLVVKESISGNIQNQSVTASVSKSDDIYYNGLSESFTLNLTNLTPQTIEWTNDLSDISDEKIGHTITLNAVAKNAKTGANSGQTITYSMPSNSYMSLSGNVLTIKAIGGPVAITATAAGNANYAPTSVTKYATVIDMSHPCATSDGHSNGQFNHGNHHDIYPTLPTKITFTARREYSSLHKNLVIRQYNSNGSEIESLRVTKDYSDISTSGTQLSINSDPSVTTIRFEASRSATYTYYITNITTTRQTKSSVSVSSLSYETDPGESLGKLLTVNYSNIPVFLSFKSDEDAGVSSGKSLWSVNTSHFGGCGKKGSQSVTVTFQSSTKGDYTDKLFVRNNVGDLLHTIDLSASVTAQQQFLDTWNLEGPYNTTDQITLQAATTVGNTNFTFTVKSSSPANIVSISNAGVMTFTGAGTATIRAYQPGDAVSQPFTTERDITINKVTPTIATKPTVAEIKYKGSFANNQLSEGLATVTLRGVKNTPVAGTFTWTSLNGTQVGDAQGSHDYSVTFTPTDGGMYNSKTFMQSVTISRADGSIEMNNGSVKVKVAGINDNLDECKIDLDGLVKSKIEDGNRAGGISFAFKSNGTKSVENAEIDANNVFTATAVGTYTIVATQAQTDYYEAASVEFTVTVNKLTPTIVFDNTDNPEIIYSGDEIEKPAYRMYNGKEIDRVVSYVSSDPSITGAIYVAGTTLTARDVQAQEGSAVTVTITASTVADALYNASEVTATHDYAVRAKRSTYFYLDGDIDATAKTLAIGGTAVITYNENVDENFTVGTEGEKAYITLVHDAVNRTITVTAQKGALAGEGVQTVTVNQPGDSRLWGRNKVYTFTVQKNVSALSLASLTNAMQVEDTVTSIYSGLANTGDAVNFSCSPEGSMKIENGKLIALQAGENTVTFSQAATEYWTGVSVSKTITVSKKDPEISTQLGTRHAWYSIIEHPFKSLNTEKLFTITSSNKTLAEYIAAEDKIYVYGTSGDVTFTVNQAENYKYDAIVNYQKTFTIFQPDNRLPMTLTSSNLEDYTGGSKGDISWNDGGVLCGGASGIGIGGAGWDYSAKYIILSFVGIPDVLSFDFQNANSFATQYGWHFFQSSDNSNWIPLKEYEDLLMNATGGTSEGSESFKLNPDTRYVKLEYHGNFGGRFKNVSITERKEIVPKANSMDFGLGYNGNDPTTRTIKVDWYNVKQCTVTITGADADKFVLGEGSNTIYSTLDNYGTAELSVSYKHETNSETTHTATLHIEDADHNYAEITLNGQTTPAPQDIIWRNDLTPMPINGVFPSAAVAASNQPITLSSDNEGIVRVDANNTLVGVAAGTARVTATAEGNTKWAETTSYIDIEVTTKNVQFIIWNDNLSNRKREDGKTVNITLTATSTSGLDITYDLDEDAKAFASISGNVLSLTGWGKGQVIAKQAGDDDYVAVQAVKSLVSRNPAAGCKPLVGEYTDEYTIWTLGEKEIELYGEPATIEFDAKCDASALWGLYVGEFYDGWYHEVAEISRLKGNNLTSSYKHFGPFDLHRNTTKVRIYTKTGATMNRTFKNVEVTLAKYLELADNQLHFEQVDKGSNKTQSFYINYSNLTGVLDVELETASTQFEVLTATVGEDCGDAGQNKEIKIRFTGKTVGTEENAIIVRNNDQTLRIPVSATVVLPSQTITWEPEVNILTTDLVTLTATATSELPVSFTSGNTDIADVVYEAGVYSLDIKSYGDVEITAHQAGNEDWSAATDKKLTYHISREVPVINTWPTAQVILPNTVGNATIIGGVAPEGIAGSFQWEDGSLEVTRQAHTFNIVFVPNNENYYNRVSQPLEIEILKTPQTITWNRADESEEGCSDIVILDATASSGLPITYHSSDSTKAYAVKDVNNVVKLYILKGGDVTITAVQPGDETYAAAPSIAKTITLIRVLPTIETLPTATDMYVHHFLSNSTPQGGVVKAGENTVTGVFVWEDGKELMDVPGTNQRTVVFQPYNSDFYQNVSTVIDVEVQRFAPTVIHSFTTEAKVYGTTLSEFVLSGSGKGYDYTDPAHYEIDGTFAWKDENQIPSVADAYATMVFHPTYTEWYDDVEIQVPITITKATIVSATATATMFYGQVLGDAVFTNTTTGIVNGTTGTVAGTITWDSSLDLMEYYVLGTYENLPIRFTPTDPNYESVEMAGTATLTVEAGFVFNGTNGSTWNDNANWQGNEAPVNNNNEKVVILADVNIDTNVSVDAMTIKEGVTVTVKDGAVLTIGNSDSYIRTTYGNLHVENGGQVILGNGELKVNNFTLDAKLGNISKSAASGQVNGDEKLDVQGDAYFTLSLDPDGAITYGWYDFVVPFEVDIVGGIYLPSNLNTPLTNGYDFAVMSYDEAKRAVNGKDWNKYSGTMEPGRVYTITVDYRHGWNELVFKKKKGASLTGDRSFTTSFSGLGEDVDNGWNGFGNGSLFHAELDVPSDALVQIYDHAHKCYQAHPAKDYSIAVGTSFFMQVGSVQTITLDVADDNGGRFMAPARNQKMVEKFNLSLKNYDENMVYDHLWVGANEDATEAYIIGEDVLKMGTLNEANIARMWTTKGGHNLCAVNAILNNDKANTTLSLYAPESGSYWLTIDEAPENATLYLTKNGKAIWNLSMNPCELDLEKGTTEGYGLRIVAREQTTTAIENVDSFNGEGIRKVMIDNVIYVITPEGKMYDITGKSVKY